jgi:phosphoglycerate dehydrogenase-like enzyme
MAGPRGAIFVSEAVERTHGAELERAAPGVPRVVLCEAGPRGDPTAVEIAYFSGDLFPERTRDFALALARAERLRWLQTFSAGVDHPWFQTLLARGVRLSTASGAAAVPIAHTVMLYLLALTRRLPLWLDAQREARWAPHEVVDLQERTLGVIGLGPIGLEVARLGQALRMRVVGVRRTPRGDEPCETWPLARLDELLPRLDAVVLALPLHDETRRLLDARRLALLRPHALLVNVGRGELVEEPALVRALADGRLGGAGLDVFATEPLRPESPLWRLPNVIVTPHSSGVTPGNQTRATAIFLENVRRYVRGEALRNEVA